MTKIHNSITELIGHTPVLRLHGFEQARNAKSSVIAKLEYFNPAGSVKDRAARALIEDAEAKGLLRPGSVIIEPTSGNTGIGLAMVASVKGYRVILTMPETMSIERRKLLKGYNAEIVLTEGTKGMNGAIEKANELARQIPHAFIPGQFENPANPRAHYDTTAPEIWEDCQGEIDYFVAAVGTGGTISGIGRYLKEKNPRIQVVAVEPAASPLLSGGQAGPHGIQGIGANFIPQIYDASVVDRVITVTDDQAYAAGREVSRTDAILVGISSGAALHAAAQIAREQEGKRIVVLLPDGGEKYLSTPLFE